MHQTASSNEQKSFLNFTKLSISDALKESMNNLGYKTLTPFQQEVFDLTNEGRNIIAFGNSNYGKSLAFNLPLVQNVDKDIESPQSLIIVQGPSQAEQIKKELNALASKSCITTEIFSHDKTCHILIATIEDLLSETFNVNYDSVKTVFIDTIKSDDLKKALDKISQYKKDVLWLIFSTQDIQDLKNEFEFLNDCAIIENTDKPKLIKPTIHIINQQNEAAPKPKTLLAAVEFFKSANYLISCNEENCNILTKYLSKYGFKVSCINEANASVFKRKLSDLIEKKIDILVCQNNILEKQDLSLVEYLINYDFPDKVFDYEKTTHFNDQGDDINRKIINIVSSRELSLLNNIKAQYQIIFEHKTLPSDEEVAKMTTARVISLFNEQLKEVETCQFEDMSSGILENERAKEIVSLLLKHYFTPTIESTPRREDSPRHNLVRPKEFTERPHKRPFREPLETVHQHQDEIKKDEQPEVEDSHSSADGIARIYISLGQKDGFNDLADLAHYLSEKSNVDMGHFCGAGMVRDQSSHIEVDEEVAQQIIDALNNQEKPSQDPSQPPTLIVCEMAKQQVFRQRYNKKNYRRKPTRR